MEFWQDEYDHVPNRWYCEGCNASIRRVEKPTICPNCKDMEEPMYADTWRLTGNSIKIGENLDDHGGVREEVYLSLGYSRPVASNGYRNDIIHLAKCTARGGSGLTGETVVDKLTPEQCAELAVMFWKLSEGWPLENMEKQEAV